ncbi:hypothetical protein OQJ18_09135 [Fluoribacter dumoffii]|uniref:hypothetical protein n=1 Tax=Fluoribacter dumoffii TaxID=463 RepID=UPI0022432754|nr:hypothetical protein [Fluoribacter dumoffii]MCW8386726.1 hypothetical protein [Fluoribacter dumoffii]MCW8417739.1 hypothetical protein [Fluoribacter dumoffii]MCW8454419.1 hypothetical protein [Fluoribacter dumoffii]MCW8461507.1 hypothetical protein [Fluoribacter dumoffii]MCW8484945.1 hypothetical protein [Fluoribacter dumoffii]
MNRFLKNSLLILFIFIVGIAVGSYYNAPIQNFINHVWEKIDHGSQPQELYFCPPAQEVVKHQYNPEAFQVGTLFWQMDYQGWKAPEKIGFMQALVNSSNNLVCYYHWPNPDDKGTYLWMTIHLSPSVNQIVQPYGEYWTKKESEVLCNSGVDACAFVLSASSKRIIPQH